MRCRVSVGLVGLVVARILGAQQIPRSEYIKYVPLHHRQLIRQTDASAQFALFGDTASPDYVDANHDGIDDHRALLLNALAVRFSPFLVRNTTSVPMDWKKFITRQQSFPLLIDRWEVSRAPGELVRSEQVDFANLGGPTTDDSALVRLLAEFDPGRPDDEQYNGTRPPDRSRFTVLFFDFPGTSPAEWRTEYRAEYSGRLPQRYEGYRKVYVHPFLTRVPNSDPATFELVLQYWFFYPFDDGGNKHEGDWEHINAVVSPRSAVERGLTAAETSALLERTPTSLDGDDPLVIKRVDHYVHNSVIVLDYANPNVYLPRATWESQRRRLEGERAGADFMFGQIRARAYADRAETIINTHPIGYIGGDSKGVELLLSGPGSRNRDSHATFPFPGVYKDIGLAASAEEVRGRFYLPDYTGPHAKPWPEMVERFDQPDLLALVPDWERVIGLMRSDARARQEYSWLVLPIRWGWPAMVSPFAGIIQNAETGNLSPVGPSFSNGWNRTGAVATFGALELQRFPSTFQLSPLDAMRNDLGFLNAPFIVITSLPPFDLLYKGIGRPVRSLFPPPLPSTFVSSAPKQFRIVGLGVGASVQFMNANTWGLLFSSDPTQLSEIDARLLQAGYKETSVLNVTASATNPVAPQFKVQFYLNTHLTAENLFRHSNSAMGLDVNADSAPTVHVRGTLDFYEYAGSIRYSFLTRAIQPYVKLGYGLSWYRLEDVSTNGAPLPTPNAPWIHQPSILRPVTFLPDEWLYGLGLELIPLLTPIPLSTPCISVTIDYSVYYHPLGISTQNQADFGLTSSPTIRRPVLTASIVVSF